jgi:Peptidase family M28
MRLADLVTRIHDDFDIEAAMADVTALCGYDRYQASEGIVAAAEYVAQRAADAGLVDVEVLRYPTEGRWWTYQGPPGWTPLSATLYVGDTAVLCYPEQPYALAAYSAATDRAADIVPWSTMDGRDLAGVLLVVDRPDVPVFQALKYAAEHGAAGVVADPLAGRPDREAGQVGRIELPPGSALAAFSATPGQLAQLCGAVSARMTVVLSKAATTMPVVTGRLPGADDGEFLLSAHLCHPRPSANDNASGVAALLGVARVLAAGHGMGARFLWGPEFIGTAAYLHDAVRPPTLALNVDMAGQDQDRCGSVLVIERSPDELPSFLSALAERCAALLPAARSYSGAVSCDRWAWRATPHLGASDHALVRCPSVGLGHWPDRFNHTSADTLDKVDPAELRRTATIAAASVAAVRHAPELASDLVDATVSWAVGHLTALPGPVSAGPGMLDPWHPARRLAHRTDVALGTVRSLAGLGLPVDDAVATVSTIAAALGGTRAEPLGSGPVLRPTWSGPFNLRALAATSVDRDWLDARITEDRGGNYARMHALARGLDGRRNWSDVAWWAALSSELPIPESFASAFLDILVAAGWATTGEG